MSSMQDRTNIANFADPPEIAVGNAPNPHRDQFNSTFGHHKRDWNDRGYNERDKAFWTTPEGLEGADGETVSAQVEFGVLLTDNFYTQWVCPIERTNRLKISWDIIKFAPTLPGVTPERGRVRIVKSSVDSKSDALQRFGTGLEFLMGFLDTPLGAFMFQMAKQQLNLAILEGLSFGVMYALLTCTDATRIMEKEIGTEMSKHEYNTILNRQKFLFGCMQRLDTPLEQLDTFITETQLTYQGQGDTYLVHWKMAAYVSQVNKQYTVYNLGGEEAIRRLKGGIEDWAADGWNGNRIYICRGYDIKGEGPIDLLKDRAVIGEWYVAWDHTRKLDIKFYSSECRSIQIYDADNDSMADIGPKEMIQNCARWDRHGKPIQIGSDEFYEKMHRSDRRDAADSQLPNEDSMHYTGIDGGLRVAKYFGQILRKHFDIAGIQRLVAGIIQRMNDPCTCAESQAAIRAGQELMHEFNSLTYSTAIDDYLYLQAITNLEKRPDLQTHPRDIGSPPIFDIGEWAHNERGGLDLPLLDEFADATMITGSDKLKANRTIVLAYEDLKDKERVRIHENDIEESLRQILTSDHNAFSIDADPSLIGVVIQDHKSAAGSKDYAVTGYIRAPGYPSRSLHFQLTTNAPTSWIRLNLRKSIEGNLTVPPLGGTYPGLRELASAYTTVSSAEEFRARYGLSYESAKKAQAFVNVFENIASDLAKFLPGAKLINPSYTSSHFHMPDVPTVLFENTLGRYRTPAFLARGPFAAGAGATGDARLFAMGMEDRNGEKSEEDPAKRPGVYGPAAPVITRDLEEQLSTVSSNLSNIVNVIEDRWTGRITTVRDAILNNRRSFNKLDGRFKASIDPLTLRIGGDYTSDLTNVSSGTAYVLNPIQKGTPANKALVKITDAAAIHSLLPPFAQQRWTVADLTANFVVVSEDGSGLFHMIPNTAAAAAADTPAIKEAKDTKDAYDSLVRLKQQTALPLNRHGIATDTFTAVTTAVLRSMIYVYSTISFVNRDLAVDAANRTAAGRLFVIVQWATTLLRENMDNGHPDISSDTFKVALKRLYSDEAKRDKSLSLFDKECKDISKVLEFIDKELASNLRNTEISLRELQKRYKSVKAAPKPRSSDSRTGFDADLLLDAKARSQKESATWRHDPSRYARAPLVFPPRMLKSLYAWMYNEEGGFARIPMVLPADPDITEFPISMAKFTAAADSIEGGTANGNALDVEKESKKLHVSISSSKTVATSIASSLEELPAFINRKRMGDIFQEGHDPRTYAVSPYPIGANMPTSVAEHSGKRHKSNAPWRKGLNKMMREKHRGGKGHRQPHDPDTGKYVPSHQIDTEMGDAAAPIGDGLSNLPTSTSLGGVALKTGTKRVGKGMDGEDSEEEGDGFGDSSASYGNTKLTEKALSGVRSAALRSMDLAFDVTKNMEDLAEEIQKRAKNWLHALVGLVYLTTPTNQENLERFVDEHIPIPFTFSGFRPYIQLGTYPIIKVLAGKSTGITYMGRSKWTWGDDAKTQVHTGTYTFHAKTIIREPKNIFRARHVYITDYYGGMGVKPFIPGTQWYNPVSKLVDSQEGSIFWILEPYTVTAYEDMITLKGTMAQTWPNSGDFSKIFKTSYANARYYCMLYGWDSEGQHAKMSESEWTYNNINQDPDNGMMFRGTVVRWNPVENKYSMITESGGYFDTQHTGPGMKKTWTSTGQQTYRVQAHYKNYTPISGNAT